MHLQKAQLFICILNLLWAVVIVIYVAKQVMKDAVMGLSASQLGLSVYKRGRKT